MTHEQWLQRLSLVQLHIEWQKHPERRRKINFEFERRAAGGGPPVC